MVSSKDTDFDSILREFGPLLSRVASSYEANAHLRQELLQEITLAVWQALRAFKGDSSLKTYVLRIAHNKAVSHVAYHAKQPYNDEYCEVTDPAPDIQTVESTASNNRKVEKLLEAVRQLPIQARQIVTMSMEGLSYQDIAQVCGMTANNVGVALMRAKQVLVEKIQDE